SAGIVVPGPAVQTASVGPDWNLRFLTYARDPFRNRHALLALRHADDESIPIVAQLAIGDAELRARQYRSAEATFARVLARSPGPPWGEFASLGLAWTALAQGEFARGRDRFSEVADAHGANAPLAEFALALLDAGEGDEDGELRFRRVAEAPGVSP